MSLSVAPDIVWCLFSKCHWQEAVSRCFMVLENPACFLILTLVSSCRIPAGLLDGDEQDAGTTQRKAGSLKFSTRNDVIFNIPGKVTSCHMTTSSALLCTFLSGETDIPRSLLWVFSMMCSVRHFWKSQDFFKILFYSISKQLLLKVLENESIFNLVSMRATIVILSIKSLLQLMITLP